MCLTERSRVLEADAEASRQALAGVLAPDCDARRSSTQNWVLGSIGLRIGDEKTFGADEARQAMQTVRGNGDVEGNGMAYVGGVWETVVREEISHRYSNEGHLVGKIF